MIFCLLLLSLFVALVWDRRMDGCTGGMDLLDELHDYV